MADFNSPIDIANRACQHCGSARIDATLGFNEQRPAAQEIGAVYGGLRKAELRRNVWRFAIRRVILRPIDTTTMLLLPALWVSSTTYFAGSIVADPNGVLWISQIPNNLGNDPQGTPAWAEYFGPLTVSLFATGGSFSAGELVYTAAGDGTNRVYQSRISANADTPATATAWSATATYFKNQTVTRSAVVYQSLIDLNINQDPAVTPAAWTSIFVGGTGSINWLQIGGAEFPMGVTVIPLNIIYPIGSGPSSQSTTRNIFRLPAGFLRQAPTDPKAGSVSYLGAPGNLGYTDWEFEGAYIVSGQVEPLMLRFVADTVDVTTFDPMFCEGLGARIGLEVCETLTQSDAKKHTIAGAYAEFMGQARTVNSIEIGSEEPYLDDYLACRG